MRKAAERFYGSRRKGMSKIVENALRSYLVMLEEERNIKYIALKKGSILAEAPTLSELADKLKALVLSQEVSEFCEAVVLRALSEEVID